MTREHQGPDQSRTPPEGVVRVLHSIPRIRDTTNPYLILLLRSLPPEVESLFFSWRTALVGRYDVVHVHWPEHLLREWGARGVLRRLAFVALLLRWRVAGTGVVRTLHNLHPHEGRGAVDGLLLRWFDATTTGAVVLQPPPEPPTARFVVEVPHGHYRPWFADLPRGASVRGRLLFFGQIRRYKGVPALVDAFAATDDDTLSLVVCGRPQDAELAADITARASADPRISLDLVHVADPALSTQLGEAELVVLPYDEMHNSGAVLLALSLDRPVLVPRTTHSAQLAQEVGPGWLFEYDGPVGPEVLTDALEQVRAVTRADRPDLGSREWATIGAAHAAAYRRARTEAR